MNDDPSDKDGTDQARFLLEQSQKALSEMLAAFDILSELMQDGEDVPRIDMVRSLTAMSQARTRLINEVKEHDDRGQFSGGGTRDAALDLDTIRAEIGRRLDRIRDTVDTERIS